MSDSFAYSYISEEETAPAPTANAPFRRMVHAFSKNAPLPNLNRHAERELIHLVQSKDCPTALATLVEHHNGFIANIASEFADYNGMRFSMDDLLSEGIQAFITAIRRFKLRRDNARLNSYARYHVSGAILTFILKNRYAFAIGTSSGERTFFFKFARFCSDFKSLHGVAFQSTSASHIALMSELSGTSSASIRRVCALRRAGSPISSQSLQIVENRTSFSPEEAAIKRDRTTILVQELRILLDNLRPRNRDIVATLMADDADVRNQRAELAAKHDVTPERIGQIYREAITDIRAALKSRGITSCA